MCGDGVQTAVSFGCGHLFVHSFIGVIFKLLVCKHNIMGIICYKKSSQQYKQWYHLRDQPLKYLIEGISNLSCVVKWLSILRGIGRTLDYHKWVQDSLECFGTSSRDILRFHSVMQTSLMYYLCKKQTTINVVFFTDI